MRAYRLIILLGLAACKATAPSSSSGEYSEDLSVHRPPLKIVAEKDSVIESKVSEYVPLTGHLKSELDSVSKVSYLHNKTGRYVDGYIIQIYSGTSRQEANDMQAKMAELFPDLNGKVSYRQPSFRVKGGKFINRLEANRVYDEVKSKFPRALLIPERFLVSYE